MVALAGVLLSLVAMAMAVYVISRRKRSDALRDSILVREHISIFSLLALAAIVGSVILFVVLLPAANDSAFLLIKGLGVLAIVLLALGMHRSRH